MSLGLRFLRCCRGTCRARNGFLSKPGNRKKGAEHAVLETQKNNFENYGTNQYSILKKSVTDVQGNYIMFVVNEKTDPIVKAFEKSLK